jgi:signal transduction histidine kinase/CheY-like chemotaxis protein
MRRVGARSPVLIGFVYGLTVLATTAIIGGTVLVSTRTVLFDDVRAYLRAVTLSAAALVDGDVLTTFTRPEQERTREYAVAVRPLFALDSADNATEEIFAGIVTGDSIRYVLDGTPAGKLGPNGLPTHRTIGETEPAWPEARLATAGDSEFVAAAESPSLWGPVVHASAPVFARNGRVAGVVGVTLNLRHYAQQKAKLDNMVFVGGAIGFLLALLSGISAYRVERSRLAAEATLTAAKAAAEANARSKGEFVANMSHEIRTPLHGVLGMSEAMLASAHTEADRRSLEVINKSASSLLGILNDILDFSKLEAGRVDLLNAPFDPRALVDDVTDLFAVKADQKGLEITVREALRAEKWPVGDAARLKQVLLNLVGNAVKFTERGYVRVELETVMIGRQTIALRIVVQDTGIGIAPEGQSKLFEQFSQGEASTARRFGGTGLGLAISRQLVLLMGGTLSVSSVENEGAHFTVDLQLPVSGVSRESPLSQRLPPGSRALVWCAGPLTREAIAEMLARQGVGMDTCDSIDTMRARLNAPVAYAFVLVDAPRGGLEVPPLLIGVRGDPPLVLLTTLHQPLNNSGLARFGASGQLRRPVREDHLEALLSDVASGRLLRLQAEASVKSASDQAVTRISSTELESRERKPRVMVVDDVELNLMVARAMLGSLGVHVTGANGGPSALEHLARERFDLVLMDCHMPAVDGYEVTRRVRAAVGPNRATPIVALSASAFAEDRERALAAGMNDFAPKPIELTGLRTVLEKWLPDYVASTAPDPATSGV